MALPKRDEEIEPQFAHVDAKLARHGRVTLKPEYEQRAIYVADGTIELNNYEVEAGRMLILQPNREVTCSAPRFARMMLLGGERVSEPRYVWWNLVSSSEGRIRHSAEAWRQGRFPVVPHETEFIPAPDMNGMRIRSGY